jgi:hypothetical protein
MPEAAQFAAGANAITSTETLKALEKLYPGYTGTRDQYTKLMKQFMAGELPPDVASYIARKGAERAVSSGTTGSEFSGNRTLRDLGLASLGLMEKGMAAFERWNAQANSFAASRMVDFTSMFITPQQQIASAFTNTENMWNRQWLANQVTAMPSPKYAAIASAAEQIDKMALSAASMGIGNMMGGTSSGPGVESIPQYGQRPYAGSGAGYGGW